MDTVNKEIAIRSIVSGSVKSYANGFSTRHLAELNNENGVINMKIHNVFIAALGKEIQYYSALARSLDSSLGNMLESMAISIAKLNYTVSQHVEGTLYREQTDYIAELLEQYKRSENRRVPKIKDYQGITKMTGTASTKRHESDYYLVDEETGMHYLIELKIGGDLDNKKARSEKEALLEQSHTLRFFAKDELPYGRNMWNFICKSNQGYDIVLSELNNMSPIMCAIVKEYI